LDSRLVVERQVRASVGDDAVVQLYALLYIEAHGVFQVSNMCRWA
jgi:hypothetical protein